MPKIQLIEETHQYLVDGQPMISVTQTIEAKHFCDQYYCDRGKAVHKMLELYNKNDLDEETLDSQLLPFLNAFKQFKKDAPHIHGIGDYKSGSFMKWHWLQTAAYRELWMNGIDEYGNPLKNIQKGYEVMGYHPIWKYTGKIDLIDIDKPFPDSVGIYLKDTGKYKVEVIKGSDLRKHILAFLTLVSATQVRQEYGI